MIVLFVWVCVCVGTCLNTPQLSTLPEPAAACSKPVLTWPALPALAKLDLGQGSVVEDYIEQTSLKKLLGKGRFGQVFSACNKTTGEKFAVKVIIAEDVDMREPYFMKQLDGCTSILQLQRAVINPFYTILQFPTMDYTLKEYLRVCKGNVMPKRNMVTAAMQLTNALSALQEKGIIHRDLHQSNAFNLRLFKHNCNCVTKYVE